MGSSPLTTEKARWLWLALLLLAAVVGAIASSASCRLGFESDRSVAARVAQQLGGAKNRNDVRAALLRRFKILGEGQGRGPWLSREAFREGDYYFHIVVGEYQGLPYRKTVEAFVCLDEEGSKPEVFVRRTAEGL